MIPDLGKVVWRKSSHSGGNGGQCVEMAVLTFGRAVRDSKNTDGAPLVFSERAIGQFLNEIKAGGFSRL
jgi:Domain of unknown function (DUF397)